MFYCTIVVDFHKRRLDILFYGSKKIWYKFFDTLFYVQKDKGRKKAVNVYGGYVRVTDFSL